MKARVAENTAHMAVEICAFGVGLQQILIRLERNVEILVDDSATKLDLENGLVGVVSHTGQQAGLHGHQIGQQSAIR